MPNFDILQNLIPPAIIISVIAYLINFYGKVISDQAPFADDRKWKSEIEGLFFFCTYVLSPIIGAYIFISKHYNPIKFTLDDWLLFLIAILVSIGLVMVQKEATKFFKENKYAHDDLYNLKKYYLIIITYIVLIIIVQSFSKNYLYIIISLIYLLLHLVGQALLNSLKGENIVIADIIFTDESRDCIKDCRILKVNNDNIRIVQNGEAAIINKSIVSKIKIKK